MCDGYLTGVLTAMTFGEFLDRQSSRTMDYVSRVKLAKKVAWDALRKREGK